MQIPADAWIWAVVVSVVVSIFTVLGFVLQTTAVRSAEQRSKHLKAGEVVLSPMWFCGMLLQTVPDFVGSAVAYSIAPISLTAPLSGVTVVANALLAPFLLGERSRPWPDAPAAAVIMLGVAMTTVTGDRRDAVRADELGEVGELMAVPLTVQVFASLFLVLVACELWQQTKRDTFEARAAADFNAPCMAYLMMPALSAAGVGVFTNVGIKLFGELVSGGSAGTSVLACLLVGVVAPAFYQNQALNRGLRLYPQSIFFPIYSSLLVLTNTLFGAVFFQEYEALLQRSGCYFLVGMACVVFGVALFSQRKHEKDDLLEPMLLEVSA